MLGIWGMEDDVSHDNRRSCVFAFAQKTGLLKAARFLRVNNSALTILCYHGISQIDEHIWRPELYLSAANFRRRLQAIKALDLTVLPLEQALDQVQNGALCQHSVVFTFDDGWYDFYNVAWPLLREYGLPVTVYQTSYYSIYNRPVFDPAISYLLWKGRDHSFTDPKLTGTDTTYSLSSTEAIAHVSQLIQTRAAKFNLTGQEKDQVVSDVAQQLHIDYDDFVESRVLQLMNPTEVAEVSRQGADIQLHTHRHELPLNKEAFLAEIRENRDWVEATVGKPADHFCYPNGHYRPEFPKWLREAGIKSATTSNLGVVSPASNPLLLPRLSDSTNVSNARFEAWLSGVGGFGSAGSACKRFFRRRAGNESLPVAAPVPVLAPLPTAAPLAVSRPDTSKISA